ncbi:uncharacterized protein LOC143477888 [Brachyhypopomus gauderio]|uniref:uncharacterized protein LOC143477888 n=1 Tax=Brachyhypopomus gauderio TaxID=698409 RepID=UPI00404292B7
MMTPLQQITILFICFILIDVNITDELWTVTLQSSTFYPAESSNITINCTMKYPEKCRETHGQIFWKEFGEQSMKIENKDRRRFIQHPNASFVIEHFRGRTKLLGDFTKNNCSLLISNIQQKDSGQYYLRVEAGCNNYSFVNNRVSINVQGHTPPVIVQKSPDFETTMAPSSPWTSAPSPMVTTYVLIAIPVSLILIVAGIVAVLVLLRQKRRGGKTFKHHQGQTSNYYENYEMPQEIHRQEEKEKEAQEEEEPIYKNVQECHKEVTVDCNQLDNIYCNVGELVY